MFLYTIYCIYIILWFYKNLKPIFPARLEITFLFQLTIGNRNIFKVWSSIHPFILKINFKCSKMSSNDSLHEFMSISLRLNINSVTEYP